MLESLVGAYVGRRRRHARDIGQARLARPVISVGNISMGGRGKTPVVAHLARLLIARGERPAILSRGYGRRRVEDGVVVVSDGTHVLADVERAGDEPLWLAHEVPGAAVFVCEQRALAGTLAERAFDCTVHLLDDGFQHVDLARDVDLVLVTPGDLSGRVFPAGRLREPVAALAAADAVIVDGPIDDAARPARETHTGSRVQQFHLTRQLGPPRLLEPGWPWPAAGRSVVALSAIAEPDRFARSLEAAGWRVAESISFRDHHWFTRADLDRVSAAFTRTGADLVMTTTKDALRLLPHRPFGCPMAAAPLAVAIEPHLAFEAWMAGRLEQARR